MVFIGLMAVRLGAGKWKGAVKRAENILAIFVSFFIFYMGIELLGDAMASSQAELRYVPFTAAGCFLGILINYFMARYKIYVGEQTGSQSLIADGYHSKMDMYCSIAVLVGIIGALFGMKSLDKLAAIVAMVLLIAAGYEILTENMRELLHPEKVENNEESSHSHGHGHFHLHTNRKMAAGLMVSLVAAWILSGVYIVEMDETGIVRRFGKVIREEVSPGIHYKLPAPIDEITLVNTDKIQTVKTGRLELLSGDTNLVNVNLSVHYQAADPIKYALNVTNLERLVQAGSTTSIREIVGQSEIDSLLTEGKEMVEISVKEQIQSIMNVNETGIKIVGVQILEMFPPDAVQASFQDLASARQDKSVYINQAIAYQNTLVPEARAKAYKQVAEAEGYKTEKVKIAEGDAVLFAEKQAAYALSKDVTEFRLYMEAMDKILPNVQKILLGADVNIDNAELWISGKGGAE